MYFSPCNIVGEMILSHFNLSSFAYYDIGHPAGVYGEFYIFMAKLSLQQIVSCLKDTTNRFRKKTVVMWVQACTKICSDFQTPMSRCCSLDFIAGTPTIGSTRLGSRETALHSSCHPPRALHSPQCRLVLQGTISEGKPVSRASSLSFSSYF